MAVTVCCQTCWTWSDLGSRTTCKRCGTPLTLADGRRVDQVLAGPPPMAAMPGGHPPPGAAPAGPNAYPPPAVGYPPAAPAMAYPMPPPGEIPADYGYAIPRSGPDFISIARIVTLAYGALVAVMLLILGTAARHVTEQSIDPLTGQLVTRTYDLGPAFLIAAIVVLGFFALSAWLTQFTAARVVFLVIDGLAILGALSELGGSTPGISGVTVSPVVSLVGLAVDAGYGAILVLSLIRPRPRPTY